MRRTPLITILSGGKSFRSDTLALPTRITAKVGLRRAPTVGVQTSAGKRNMAIRYTIYPSFVPLKIANSESTKLFGSWAGVDHMFFQRSRRGGTCPREEGTMRYRRVVGIGAAFMLLFGKITILCQHMVLAQGRGACTTPANRDLHGGG